MWLVDNAGIWQYHWQYPQRYPRYCCRYCYRYCISMWLGWFLHWVKTYQDKNQLVFISIVYTISWWCWFRRSSFGVIMIEERWPNGSLLVAANYIRAKFFIFDLTKTISEKQDGRWHARVACTWNSLYSGKNDISWIVFWGAKVYFRRPFWPCECAFGHFWKHYLNAMDKPPLIPSSAYMPSYVRVSECAVLQIG